MLNTRRLPTSLRLCMIGLLCSPTILLAQSEARWYQVEVIAFAQNSQSYHQSELWPQDYTLPETEKSRELSRSRIDTTQKPSRPPTPFSRLTQNSLQLQGAARRIESARDVELLLHTGWVQPGLPENKAVAIHFYEGMEDGLDSTATNGANPLRLDGTVRLILSRYLHLESDLLWRDPVDATMASPAAAAQQSGETTITGDGRGVVSADTAVASTMEGTVLESGYRVYRLQQSRRMRSNEIHYIDHPRFGLVVLVTPYDVE